MAVKPITNKQVVASSQINRATQRSLKSENQDIGNREKSIIPGKNFDKNYNVRFVLLDLKQESLD